MKLIRRTLLILIAAALPVIAGAQGEAAAPAAAPAAAAPEPSPAPAVAAPEPTPAPAATAAAPPPPPASAPAERKHRDLGDIYTQCGLGGLIARHTPWLAVTTNLVWDIGITATSSELSTPESCKGTDAKVAALILETYPAMERELAQGGGEHVDALLAVASCDSSVKSDVTAAVRREFAQVVAAPGYATQPRVEQARSLYGVFSTQVEQNFAQSCTLG